MIWDRKSDNGGQRRGGHGYGHRGRDAAVHEPRARLVLVAWTRAAISTVLRASLTRCSRETLRSLDRFAKRFWTCKALDSPSRPLPLIRDTVPDHVEQAVSRALARTPADRFRTMQEFIDALLNYGIPPKEIIRRSAGGPAVREEVDAPVPIVLKPLMHEVDFFGLTHPGKAHRINQDHFLVCTVARELSIHQTSLSNASRLPRMGERQAFLIMVADGLGRGGWGEEASRLAMEVLAQFMVHSVPCYCTDNEVQELEFIEALKEAAQQCRANVAQRARENPGAYGMASSLLMWIGRWPRAYILQVGHGRCYELHGGKLTQLTQDASNGTLSRVQPSTGTINIGGGAWGSCAPKG